MLWKHRAKAVSIKVYDPRDPKRYHVDVFPLEDFPLEFTGQFGRQTYIAEDLKGLNELTESQYRYIRQLKRELIVNGLSVPPFYPYGPPSRSNYASFIGPKRNY